MTLTPDIIKRLSFIKSFYQFAREQSKLPPPQNFISVLMFHDSVELFLHLSAEYLDANLDNINFMKYFNRIDEKLENQNLTQKAAINTLNKERVSLKHYNLYPNPDNIEMHRVNTQNFFNENCPVIFGIEFDEVSLLNLIQDEEVKETLEKAQNEFNDNQYKESLENIAIAFQILLENYEENKKVYGRSPFDIGSDLEFDMAFRRNYPTELEGLYSLEKTIQKIQDVLKIIILNLDYRKYLKFRLLTPDKVIYAKNVRFSTIWFSGRGEMDFKKEDVQYCINFVIESALKLYGFDFEIDKESFLHSFFT